MQTGECIKSPDLLQSIRFNAHVSKKKLRSIKGCRTLFSKAASNVLPFVKGNKHIYLGHTPEVRLDDDVGNCYITLQ